MAGFLPGDPTGILSSATGRQLDLLDAKDDLLPSVEEEATGDHGEVFTRRWVANLILDLVGYTPDKDLCGMVALEPACGSGAFLVPMVERLVASAALQGRDLAAGHAAIQAFDLLQGNVARSRGSVESCLVLNGVDAQLATALAASWVQRRDFLLRPPPNKSADFVVGNPPYIRLEGVPRERSDAYRRACITMGGRADVYVGFYEHGMLSLRDEGVLGFICADRWMRNAYGANLRELVSTGWSVDVIVSMTGVDAFEDEVDAYPAVTVLRRGRQCSGPLVVEGEKNLSEAGALEIATLATQPQVDPISGLGFEAARLHGWFKGKAGWPNGRPAQLAVIADLEASFPPLEDPATKTKVGIGVASGADKIYIVKDPDLVEPERLLPLALPKDISSGRVEWSGKYLVNPWDDAGLVALDDWPRFAEYLGGHRRNLSERHTAQAGVWHKTIDRVIPGLLARQKLYLPDFKEMIFPVLDEGKTYPHHNLYWVTSEVWDMHVLGGLLLSDIANLFIEAYSVRMRGGFLRFQAQYLRRIRLPHVAQVDETACAALRAAFISRDRAAATAAALPLYGLQELPT